MEITKQNFHIWKWKTKSPEPNRKILALNYTAVFFLCAILTENWIYLSNVWLMSRFQWIHIWLMDHFQWTGVLDHWCCSSRNGLGTTTSMMPASRPYLVTRWPSCWSITSRVSPDNTFVTSKVFLLYWTSSVHTYRFGKWFDVYYYWVFGFIMFCIFWN